jgi:hypothetical protein
MQDKCRGPDLACEEVYRQCRKKLFNGVLHKISLTHVNGEWGVCNCGDDLIDALCNGIDPKEAAERWRDAVLAALQVRITACFASGNPVSSLWACAPALLADLKPLVALLEGALDALCHADNNARLGILWNNLRRFYSKVADRDAGDSPTRERVWRKLDAMRRVLDPDGKLIFPQDVVEVFEQIEKERAESNGKDPFKDAPRTLGNVLSYFFDFDPRFLDLNELEEGHIEDLATWVDLPLTPLAVLEQKDDGGLDDCVQKLDEKHRKVIEAIKWGKDLPSDKH